MRRRVCHTLGLVHVTVPLGDLRALDLPTPVESILHAATGGAWSDSRGRARSDSMGSNSSSCGEVKPLPAAAELGDENAETRSVDSGRHSRSAGGTESYASTLLEDDELAAREFINTQSAAHVYRWLNPTPTVPEEMLETR